MNKRKREAWRKHRLSAKKSDAKRRLQAGSTSARR